MSGNLDHSPADIIRDLLIDLSLGTLPTNNTAWPVFRSNQPDSPDNSICVFDTENELQGRRQTDGVTIEFYGILIRVRGVDYSTGFNKAKDIAHQLDTEVLRDDVTIGSDTYRVQAVTRRGGVLSLGSELGVSRRRLFTINAVASIYQTAGT